MISLLIPGEFGDYVSVNTPILSLISQAVSQYIASIPSLAGSIITHKDYEVLNDVLKVLDLTHQTQELLSSDKTPTLAFALPVYHALIHQW